MLRHPVREMLPYPFLGREHHPAAAHKVPDVEAVLAPFQSYVGRGEVQFQHRGEIWSKEGGVLLPIHSFCLYLMKFDIEFMIIKPLRRTHVRIGNG